jgi:hypothetical protein
MVALAGGLPRFDPENAHDLGIRMRLGEILGGEAGARLRRPPPAPIRPLAASSPHQAR